LALVATGIIRAHLSSSCFEESLFHLLKMRIRNIGYQYVHLFSPSVCPYDKVW
jgi:hypothetical protein